MSKYLLTKNKMIVLIIGLSLSIIGITSPFYLGVPKPLPLWSPMIFVSGFLALIITMSIVFQRVEQFFIGVEE